ncbi:dihydroorotate dehydrogenase [Candidatus Woesearchaeota archaeon]|nr:dihydroorotate dehydrogenase [Candidatus Woesearchaeota archaeon]
MNELKINLCGISMKNPLILASGILGVSNEYFKTLEENGAGAVVIKSISREPRSGHPNPVILAYEAGLMNAVGYSNPGLDIAKEEFSKITVKIPVIASIIGSEPKDFEYMAKNFLHDGFAAVEIPLSCPHTPGFGTLAGQGTPQATTAITKAVRKHTKLPIIVKLSPNIDSIGTVAQAAEKAGADAISACNTLGPGMVINIETAKPFLDFKVGGVSGPALRPIAVRCVYDIFKSVKIPIIGIGGVTTGRDAIEMMMAGASAVGLGTAVYYRGVGVFNKIAEEMSDWLKENNYTNVSEIIGVAHE